MNRKSRPIAQAMAFVSCCFVSSSFAGKVAKTNELNMKSVPGEVLIKLVDGINAKSINFPKGIKINRQFSVSFGQYAIVQSNQMKSNGETIKSLKKVKGIEYAEPNYIYTTQDIQEVDAPSDPRFNQLWGLRNTGNNEPVSEGMASGVVGADINALKAWDITRGSKQVKIAVIDTGIDYNHQDLKENMWVNEKEANGVAGVDDDGNGYIDDIRGYDFANNDADPMDGHGHGTHCAGTIGAIHNNQLGVAGVMDEVTLVPIKFLSDSGSGTTEAAIKAIDYATKLNVDVMSNSWGGGGFSQALLDAIKNAKEKGIMFVAAAGNSSSDNDARPQYPASYNVENVISVAAHTAQDNLASFSCYGRRTVHIAAPGKNILSTVAGNNYAVYSGTSMATPHVSGALGLLIAKEGRLNVSDVRERVIKTSVPIATYRGKSQSNGRLETYNLLTDTRPERNGPNPDAWREISLNEVFETVHPYRDSQNLEKTYTVNGARYIRAVVEKYDMEASYDFLSVISGRGDVIERLTGKGENYITDYVDGSSIRFSFASDTSVNGWGVKIIKLQVQ